MRYWLSIGLFQLFGRFPVYRYVSDCGSRGASLIPAWSYTYVEIDREIISKVILLLSAESNYNQKNVHKVSTG